MKIVSIKKEVSISYNGKYCTKGGDSCRFVHTIEDPEYGTLPVCGLYGCEVLIDEENVGDLIRDEQCIEEFTPELLEGFTW